MGKDFCRSSICAPEYRSHQTAPALHARPAALRLGVSTHQESQPPEGKRLNPRAAGGERAGGRVGDTQGRERVRGVQTPFGHICGGTQCARLSAWHQSKGFLTVKTFLE